LRPHLHQADLDAERHRHPSDDRPGDALHYARAALHDFQRVGPGAARNTANTQELITRLEERNP
jgi:hypothetical protein